MPDRAFDLLVPYIQSAPENSLWLADENLLQASVTPNPALIVISNRLDLAADFETAGWHQQFSDFDLSGIADNSITRICYRISKEKPLVHHLINEAARVLRPDGELILTGDKGEGIKGYIDKAAKLLGGDKTASKADANTWLGIISQGATDVSRLLDSKEYPSFRQAPQDGQFHFWSKPGQFGWNKIDKGSALLIEHLPEILKRLAAKPERILDIGCGYGYLSLKTSALLPDSQIIACDNNAAALASCQRNFEEYAVNGEVIAASCAQGVTGKFELIVCNPPFHAGFDVEFDLTDRFLQATRDKLHKDGLAAYVVNQHIPLERKARNYFAIAETYLDSGNFKLVLLQHPC